MVYHRYYRIDDDHIHDRMLDETIEILEEHDYRNHYAIRDTDDNWYDISKDNIEEDR